MPALNQHWFIVTCYQGGSMRFSKSTGTVHCLIPRPMISQEATTSFSKKDGFSGITFTLCLDLPWLDLDLCPVIGRDCHLDQSRSLYVGWCRMKSGVRIEDLSLYLSHVSWLYSSLSQKKQVMFAQCLANVGSMLYSPNLLVHHVGVNYASDGMSIYLCGLQQT